jgi:EAL domain-containing protein (putative c-di-GMP-specific phosphodiesterase class I)/DNA-binding NarL/FixJ family response regulator
MDDINTQLVMLVDDDPFMLNLIQRMLRKDGWNNVRSYASGNTALADLDAELAQPTLILCDLNMPHVDGIEFIRALAMRNYAGALILISGVDLRVLQTAGKVVRAYGIRLLGSLQKPVQPGELAGMMLDLEQSVSDHFVPRQPLKTYLPMEIERALRLGELVNYYQPKVEVAGGRLAGFEALIRWRHPDDGLVMPDQFIGVAEESGMIDELTKIVLRQALQDLGRWRAAGLDVGVAVNVSMENLTRLDFPDVVTAELARHGQQACHLTLEITESRLSRDPLAALDILTRMGMKGVCLAIDDFGTGHSSLTQLHDLPFNQLKIDKSFVHQAWLAPTTHAIYNASLSVAKQLTLESVAEGVERLDDWEFLRRTGCEFAQGYFIARPMPAEAIKTWCLHWNERMQLLSNLEAL